MYHHCMTTKYTARFDHIIKASDIIRGNKLNISEASVGQLKQWLPIGVDFSRNEDLLGLAFDVALVNVFNANGDGISSEGAVKMRPTLSYKPINIEHDRSVVIGNIIEGNFSDVDFKKFLSAEDVIGKTIPFNITLGGVLYKVVAKELGELLLDIQSGKMTDFTVASSWEVGFDSYFAAIGSKFLSECKIVTDAKDVEELSQYMKCFGGKGTLPTGEPINRLIDPNGTIVFLGAGLTKYPAASVGPVYVFDYSDVIKENSPQAVSHFNKDDVLSLRTGKNMDREEIIKMLKEVAASASDSKEIQESFASVTSKIADAIIESNKTFVAEKEEAVKKVQEQEAKAKEQEVKISDLEKKIGETNTALEAASAKLQKIEDEAKAVAEKEKFNERMSALDSEFQLEDADRKIIAKKVSSVESDEEFAELKKELGVLMAGKSKARIQEVKAAEEKKMKESLAEELKKRGIADPLDDKAPEKKDNTPNNSATASETTPSIREKFSKALDKKQIKVTI